jgi:hypothetical protein
MEDINLITSGQIHSFLNLCMLLFGEGSRNLDRSPLVSIQVLSVYCVLRFVN